MIERDPCEDLVVGLDVGTTKVAAVAGLARPGGVQVLAAATEPCEGTNGDEVVSVLETAAAMHQVVADLEALCRRRICSVHLGVGGSHVRTDLVRWSAPPAPAPASDGSIETEAYADAVEQGRLVLHAWPAGAPSGGPAGHVRLLSASTPYVHGLVRCAVWAGLDVADIVLGALATAEAVLGPEERQAGVAVVDIGGAATEIAVFAGKFVHVEAIALGAQHVTARLAELLDAPATEAERVKLGYSVGAFDDCVAAWNRRGEQRSVPRRVLGAAIDGGMGELLHAVKQRLAAQGLLSRLGSGVVLAGAGAMIDGMAACAAAILGRPARLGDPAISSPARQSDTYLCHPKYATALGLVHLAALRTAHWDGALALSA
ncbi:MAG: hypothetical protein HY744_06265 [Deltaproteobacteria bacterium]|nr:hypothetical protein [Deltaproteobacteria bacterium]